jgi:hypothetical protein
MRESRELNVGSMPQAREFIQGLTNQKSWLHNDNSVAIDLSLRRSIGTAADLGFISFSYRRRLDIVAFKPSPESPELLHAESYARWKDVRY